MNAPDYAPDDFKCGTFDPKVRALITPEMRAKMDADFGRKFMSVTILEALQNAEINLKNGSPIGLLLAREQLHNAVALLQKNYAPDDNFDALVGKHGTVDAVPEKDTSEFDELRNLVRSACAIAERGGAETAWDRYLSSAAKIGLNGVTARTYRLLPEEPRDLPCGTELIAAERERQIAVEGWKAEHDDIHAGGEILNAALSYVMQADALAKGIKTPPDFIPSFWPWGKAWWKPSEEPVVNLTKAGALIAAEIDRLKRAAK